MTELTAEDLIRFGEILAEIKAVVAERDALRVENEWLENIRSKLCYSNNGLTARVAELESLLRDFLEATPECAWTKEARKALAGKEEQRMTGSRNNAARVLGGLLRELEHDVDEELVEAAAHYLDEEVTAEMFTIGQSYLDACQPPAVALLAENEWLRARIFEMEKLEAAETAALRDRVAEYHTAIEIAYDFLVGAGFDMESVPLRKITALARKLK